MFLEDKERQSLRAVTDRLSNPADPIKRFFEVLDKIDPIISVWRYLHHLRGRLNDKCHEFLERLKDFFDNPHVKEITVAYREDTRFRELVSVLQNREMAEKYYRARGQIKETGRFGFDTETILKIIEGRSIIFAESGAPKEHRGRARAIARRGRRK